MKGGDWTICLRGIDKNYGTKVAVEGLDLSIPPATICGILGPNGAGKTTTIRIILDIIGADRGTVEVLGGPVTPATRERIGYLPEERGVYPKMKVREFLVFLAQLKGMDRSAAGSRADGWLERFDLSDWAGRRLEQLSKGMQQKVQFIGTLLHDPELLILDEPFAGLDPLNVDLLKEIVLEQKERGTTVLFSTHNMEQAERLCDRVVMIRNARKVLDGELSQIKHDAWLNGQRRVLLSLGDGSGGGGGGGRGDGLLEDRALVKHAEDMGTHISVELQEGIEPQQLLEAALARGARIDRFEVSVPSLHQIFVAYARE